MKFHSVWTFGFWEFCSSLRPICFPQHEKSTFIMEQTDALKSSHFNNLCTETSYWKSCCWVGPETGLLAHPFSTRFTHLWTIEVVEPKSCLSFSDWCQCLHALAYSPFLCSAARSKFFSLLILFFLCKFTVTGSIHVDTCRSSRYLAVA